VVTSQAGCLHHVLPAAEVPLAIANVLCHKCYVTLDFSSYIDRALLSLIFSRENGGSVATQFCFTKLYFLSAASIDVLSFNSFVYMSILYYCI
jgi:hypothetical protein